LIIAAIIWIVAIVATVIVVVLELSRPQSRRSPEGNKKDPQQEPSPSPIVSSLDPSSAPPSTRLFTPNTAVAVVSKTGGYCLDVVVPSEDDATRSTNAAVVVRDDLVLEICNSSASSQFWLFDNDGYIRSSLDSNKCIQVKGSVYNSGMPIEVQNCDIGNPTQQWNFLADGSIQSVGNSNYCIDENGPGSNLYLWNCDGSSDQFWSLVEAPFLLSLAPSRTPATLPKPATSNEVAIISVLNDDLCLDMIPNDNTTDGVDLLVLGSCDSTSTSQSWLFSTDGHISSSLDSNKCIQVQGSVYSSGTPIEIQDCVSGNPAQQWNYLADGSIQSTGNSNYCIVNENGEGSNVYIRTCNGSTDQFWMM